MTLRWLALLGWACCCACSAPTGNVLRIATGDSGPGLAPHRQILQTLQAELPDTRLQLEPVSGGDYYTRLLTELASGTPPDILQVGDDAVGWFASRGCLADLSARDLPLQQFFPAVLAPGKSGGALYVLPKDYTPLAVYCNKRLFREAGLELPRGGWELPEFLGIARQLTNGRHYGLVIPGVRSAILEWLVLLHGGQFFDPQRQCYAGAMDGPATLEAMEVFQDLYYRSRVSPLPSELGSFGGGNLEFEQGRAAMKIGGHWNLADLKNNPQIDLAILPLPGLRGRRVNLLHWAGMGIARGSQHQEVAWKVLQRYCGPTGSEAFSAWALPAVKEVARARGLLSDPLERVWLEELDHVQPRAYTFDPLWMQVGEAAVARLHEAVVVKPGLISQAWLTRAARQADAMRAQRLLEP